jgi:DNA-binding winged helix-turn-helix (wHTH) protein
MFLREVWQCTFVPNTNLVDVHMGRLRSKIDGTHEPPMILTVRGRIFILHIEDGQVCLQQTKMMKDGRDEPALLSS